MRRFLLELVRPKYLLVLALAVVADVVAAVHFLSLARDWLALVNASGFMLPFVNLLAHVWFIEAKTLTERLAITTHTAVGICIGTTITILVCR